MADTPSNFAALPPRQKVTVIVFLVIAVFVVWEVIGMFRGGGSSNSNITSSQPAAPPTTVQATPKPSMTPTSPSGPRPAAAPITSQAPHVAAATAHLTPQQSHPEVEITPPPSPVLLQQEQVQTKYVSALNELQMLKIQKEIAETSQAIVAAKLATATAEKSISDLLSEAEAAAMPLSGKKESSATSTNVAPLPPMPEMNRGSYSVQSVTMEQDQWHAVVKWKDKLYDVSLGDMLPPDNSTVKAIDQRGVTLENGGFEQRIPLTVTDNVGPSKEKNNSSAPAGPGAGS